MFLLGYDIGSSAIKATLLNADTGEVVATATSPQKELEIHALKMGWAEQSPEEWWLHVKNATAEIRDTLNKRTLPVQAIGISYQMHGLVIVDKRHEVLRPSIIWCDSRAVDVGEHAFHELGETLCLSHFLNSPGNFTASKLRWVRENEPEIYKKIHKAMLPGDYIAMKMSGEIRTTIAGLSEGIMWDYKEDGLARIILDYYDISPDLVADAVPSFSSQGELTISAAGELGLEPGAKIGYRAGDQPNNAFSLNVLNPGELAATAGTSGVVYAIDDKPVFDRKSRVNTFVHVNHDRKKPRFGVLLCINGTGILNSWLKRNFARTGSDEFTYDKMNALAASTPIGADGLIVLPYGNGAERTLENKDPGASVHGLRFTRHSRSHLLRAAQEGIVFAMNHGLQIMRDMGLQLQTVKAGNANMFLSPLFTEAFSSVTQTVIELFDTDGSQGAARGAGLGTGVYSSLKDAFTGLKKVSEIDPDESASPLYEEAYQKWLRKLEEQI